MLSSIILDFAYILPQLFAYKSTKELIVFSKSKNHIWLGEGILNRVPHCPHNSVFDIKSEALISVILKTFSKQLLCTRHCVSCAQYWKYSKTHMNFKSSRSSSLYLLKAGLWHTTLLVAMSIRGKRIPGLIVLIVKDLMPGKMNCFIFFLSYLILNSRASYFNFINRLFQIQRNIV